jgi:hypothetical protein
VVGAEVRRLVESDGIVHGVRYQASGGWLVRLLFRLPLLRDLPARMVAYGLWRVHVEG